MTKNRRGQSVVEYVLVISVICIALAVGFISMGESVRGIFENARTTIQQPYP